MGLFLAAAPILASSLFVSVFGDDESCPPEMIVNCANENSCAPEHWLGDGYCDGFAASYGVDFCCYENDGTLLSE